MPKEAYRSTGLEIIRFRGESVIVTSASGDEPKDNEKDYGLPIIKP